MNNSRAVTVAQANAQKFEPPFEFNDETWRAFAASIDGYAIAQELGFDLREWGAAHDKKFQETGEWDLKTPLEVRLMLFYEFRSDYFSGYTYHENDEKVKSLLELLNEKLSQKK